MGGQSVEELERVIGATRRVVERLQIENDALKKQTAKSKPRPDLAKENQTLKQQVSVTIPLIHSLCTFSSSFVWTMLGI